MARSTFSITMFEMFSMLAVGGRLIVLERDRASTFGACLQLCVKSRCCTPSGQSAAPIAGLRARSPRPSVRV